MRQRLIGYLVPFVAAVLLLVGWVLAEVQGSAAISVTSTSATTALSRPAGDLTLISDTTSANELYARVFHCGDNVAAATTSSPIRLEPGESVSFSFRTQGEGDPATLSAPGYCAFTVITAAAETATLRYLAK